MEDEYMTDPEVARLLRRSLSGLGRLRGDKAEGFPAPVKLGGKRSRNLTRRADIEAYLAKKREAAEAERRARRDCREEGCSANPS